MKKKDSQMTYELSFSEDELVVIRSALMHCTALPNKERRKIFGDDGRADMALNIDEDLYRILFNV